MQKDHAAVRLEPADMARVLKLAEAMTTPHLEATKSMVLRALILGSLDAFEVKYGIKGSGTMADPTRPKKRGGGK
jgi:hypothetical protein